MRKKIMNRLISECEYYSNDMNKCRNTFDGKCIKDNCAVYKLMLKCLELQEWKDANKPTGICETCTAKSLQAYDICRNALSDIDQVIKCSEQISVLNSDEIKKLREILNIVNTELHKLKEVQQ